MTKSEEKIIKAAVAFFKENKPVFWSMEEYIKNPEVTNRNKTFPHIRRFNNQLRLANAVADYLKKKPITRVVKGIHVINGDLYKFTK